MAAIYKYKQKRDELHIYHNRIPKKDGREPWLFWSPVAAVFLFFRAAGLVLAGVTAYLFDEVRAELMADLPKTALLFAVDIVISVALAAYLYGQLRKIVFSARKGEVYDAFLFFRRRKARFSDLGALKISDQETKAVVHYAYVATWRDDELREPLRLSPKVESFDRLARYYHTIVPMLAEMLELPAPEAPDAAGVRTPSGDADEGTAWNDEEAAEDLVLVEEVEVPLAEAERLLARAGDEASGSDWMPLGDGETGHDEPPAPDDPEEREEDEAPLPRPEWFVLRDGVYRTPPNPARAASTLLSLALLALYAVCAHLFLDWFPARIAAGIFLFFSLMFAAFKSRVVSVDPADGEIVVRTFFGLLKRSVFADDLAKLTVKHRWPAKTLCLVVKGRQVDPSLVSTTSRKTLKLAMDEFAAILGMDSRKLLDV